MELHEAIEEGDIEAVKQHIAAGADVNKDKDGFTPLHFAVEEGRTMIVYLLIAAGADVNKDKDGFTPLHGGPSAHQAYRDSAGKPRGASKRLKHALAFEAATRHYAGTDNKQITEMLIKNGADVNAKSSDAGTPLDCAIKLNRNKTADILRKHGGKAKTTDISIHEAAERGNIEAIKHHLAEGADVNKDKDGFTPLHSAARYGHKEIVELLIANGADLEADAGLVLLDDGETADSFFYGPLHSAARSGHHEIAELLIAGGSDVNAKDTAATFGQTPLHLAVENGYTQTAKRLIANGADVNAKDEQGKTPLHYYHVVNNGGLRADKRASYSAWRPHEDLAELLIAEGADVNAKDGDGDTPLHSAAQNGHREIAELLIAKGADVNAKGYWGAYPLHLAAYKGHNVPQGRNRVEEVAELLIAKGADVNAKDVDSRTPVDWAKKVEDWQSSETKAAKKEIVDLLRKHGGKMGRWVKS